VKTLVIHPFDESTSFLEAVYEKVPLKTVIRGGLSREEVQTLISSHDRIMMMGHGSPRGLLSVSQFPEAGPYIIDGFSAGLLRMKKNSVFIWCYADQFVHNRCLNGFCSGMFVSEMDEACIIGIKGVTQDLIDRSNDRFSQVAGLHINGESAERICENIKKEYGILANQNPVIRHNYMRLYSK